MKIKFLDKVQAMILNLSQLYIKKKPFKMITGKNIIVYFFSN